MVKWFDDESNPTPFHKALEATRRLAKREGWRYQHVQAIIVALINMLKQRPATATSF